MSVDTALVDTNVLLSRVHAGHFSAACRHRHLSDASNAARPRGDRFGAGPVFRPDTLPDRGSLPAVRNRSPSVGQRLVDVSMEVRSR